MNLRQLHAEIGRILNAHPEAERDPVLDTRCHSSAEFYLPDWEVAKVVLHDPGDWGGYVTLEME